MTTTTLLRVLPLFLILHACSGGGRAEGDRGGAGTPMGIFDFVGSAGSSGSTGSATDASVDATVDPLEPVGPDGGTDSGEVADAGTSALDASTDASTVDAGHDAGPPPLAGTCDPCTVDADCVSTHYCARSDAAGGRFCFPPKTGGSCNYPGGYLYYGTTVADPNGVGYIMLCTPHGALVGSSLPTITCAEWHTLTGL